jgi:hypothetical protein
MNPMKPATAEAAREAYRKSARFHAICNSIVSQEMLLAARALDDVEHEPWLAREVCDRIAIDVAARVLQTIYENDTEIAQWKQLAERMTDSALEISRLAPMPIVVRKDAL